MSVSVANNTANISGQTVILAGKDATITGLQTFDRDPSAPFAVSASSAVVPNLDADKLDGQEGSYYTNASNLASGTLPEARFPGSAYYGATTRTVMSGNATLTSSSTPYQFFDPDAARDVTLPTAATNMAFVIKNFDTSGYALTIKDAAAATVTTVVNGQTVMVIYDGTAWQVIS